jgi:hypothetical protein
VYLETDIGNTEKDGSYEPSLICTQLVLIVF